MTPNDILKANGQWDSITGLTRAQEAVYYDDSRFRTAVCARRFGKALHIDTPIPTPKGFITIGDLRIFDKVFDEKGKECTVTSHTGSFIPDDYYLVTFSDGVTFKACGDHQWFTQTKLDRRRDREGSTKTTREIADSLVYGGISNTKPETNHSISLSSAVSNKERILPLDPYLLGCWLGDGHSYSAQITTMDSEIVSSFLAQGFRLRPVNHQNAGKATTYAIVGSEKGVFINCLYDAGFVRNDKRKFTKYIPEEYLFATIEQRIALLQGIMDTDGSIVKDGTNKCEITFASEILIKDVASLLCSLGMKAPIHPKVINGVTYYRISFATTMNVFRLQRKSSRYNISFKPRGKQSLRRFITGCELLPYVEEVCCITVDSESHLYLAGRSFVTTHNTVLAVNELIRAAQVKDKQEVWYLAPTYKMAKRIMWRMLKDAIPREAIAEKNEQDLSILIKDFESLISLKGCEDGDSLRGDDLNFTVFDEVQDIDIDVIDVVIRPALGNAMGEGLYIGTPKGMGENTIYQLYLRGLSEPDWKSWVFTTAEGGNVPLAEIASAKRVMTETKFKQEFLASFEAVQGRVFYNFSPTESVTDEVFDDGSTILCGIDFNVNPMSATLAVKKGDSLHIFDEFSIPNANTRLLCQSIKDKYPGRSITTYPDPSGKSRSTKAEVGQTDFTIIKSFKFGLEAPRKAPLVVDSVNDVNALLLNADGDRRLLIHPRCKQVIKSLDGLLYKQGTSEPDKTSGLDHQVDSIRYIVSQEFSIIKREVTVLTLDHSY